jgi:integrase
MSVHLRKKYNTWYCKYYDEYRKSHKEYFGEGKDAELKAREFDLKIKKMKHQGIKVNREKEKAKQKLTFFELVKSYLNDKRTSGWSEKSVYDFKCLMQKYVLPCLWDKVCHEMDMSDHDNLRDYIAKNASRKKISPNSINRYINMTRPVFSWGVRHDKIERNPWPKCPQKKESPAPPDLLTIKELVRIMECAEPHCGWAIDVAFNTGCRPGPTELFKLMYKDVNWEEGTLKIKGTKTGERTVPLKWDFLERLRARRNDSKTGHIIELEGKPVKSIKRSFKTALKRAGIEKKVRLYDIRHMYCTMMARNGMNIFDLMDVMGHSNLDTTKGYYNRAMLVKREAVEKLPSLEGVVKNQKEMGRVLQIVPKSSPQMQQEASTELLTP